MSDKAGRAEKFASLECDDGERNSIAIQRTSEPLPPLLQRFPAANMPPLLVHPLNERVERFRMIRQVFDGHAGRSYQV